MNKLLSIKKDNNVVIYSVTYDRDRLVEYINFLEKFYGYTEYPTINTQVKDNRSLSMGKYDFMKKYCTVSEKYKLIEDYGEDEKGLHDVKITISVRFRSILADTLKKTFLNDEPLINTTDLIKVMYHLYEIPTSFTFDPLLDMDEENKEWNDPSRTFTSVEDYRRYMEYKKKRLNVDDVKLNKRENKSLYNDSENIINRLNGIIKYEQVGMFPIDENLPEIQVILKRFGKRNENIELIVGSLEDTKIDINGAKKINELSSDILNRYALEMEEQPKVKEHINLYEKVKSFLQF